jgi:1-acyl-sn-glycerol-3-phosphate acyltransferase
MVYKQGGLLLLALLLLGWSFQTEGSKFNSTVKVIDLLINFVIMGISIISIVRGGRESALGAILFIRSYYNIYPLCKIMFANLIKQPTQKSVQETCCEARRDFNIHWERGFKNPCVYVANHALWSLDDIVVMGAISRRNLAFVINRGPVGLTGIPDHCREYTCVLGRKNNDRGEGYQLMKEIFEQEILKNKKSLIVFVENMKTKTDSQVPAGQLRTGTIKLARELGIPIVPIWIHWPGIFPSILSPISKTAIVKEGWVINTDKTTENIKEEIKKCWLSLSR